MPPLSRRNLMGLVTVGAAVTAAGLPGTTALAQTAEVVVPPLALRDYTTSPIVDNAGQFILLRS